MQEAKTKSHDTRKHRQLRVPVLQEEAESIKNLASAAGLPVARYLRTVGLGYRVQGILDNKRVEELAKINGDLGRLGGLLKLWLTDDYRTAHIGASTVRAVLSKIEENQTEILKVMRLVVMPGKFQMKT